MSSQVADIALTEIGIEARVSRTEAGFSGQRYQVELDKFPFRISQWWPFIVHFSIKTARAMDREGAVEFSQKLMTAQPIF